MGPRQEITAHELVKNAFMRADTDGNGYLSAQEARVYFSDLISKRSNHMAAQYLRPARARLSISPYEALDTIQVDNVPVHDRRTFTYDVADLFKISPQKADALIQQVFPHGVEEVRFYDWCKTYTVPSNACIPLTPSITGMNVRNGIRL